MSKIIVTAVEFMDGGCSISYLLEDNVHEGGNLFLTQTMHIGPESILSGSVNDLREEAIDLVMDSVERFNSTPTWEPDDDES